MQNFLILDTSTKVQIFVLIYNGIIKDIYKNCSNHDYVSSCIPLMDSFLKKNNITLHQLDGLIVGIGPGSYTGTRVAVLTAKIIAFSLRIPLYKISSLLLLTSGYSTNFLTPLIDARNNFFFSLSLEKSKIILAEGRYLKLFLENYNNHVLIDYDSIRFDFRKICFYMEKVSDIHNLVPNYLIQI